MIGKIRYDRLELSYYFYKNGKVFVCDRCDCREFEESKNEYMKCTDCGALYQAVKDLGN